MELAKITGTEGRYEINYGRRGLGLGYVQGHLAYNASNDADETHYLIVGERVYAAENVIVGWMFARADGSFEMSHMGASVHRVRERRVSRARRIEVIEAPSFPGRSESHRFVASTGARGGIGWGATRVEAARAAVKDLKANRAFIGPRRPNGDR